MKCQVFFLLSNQNKDNSHDLKHTIPTLGMKLSSFSYQLFISEEGRQVNEPEEDVEVDEKGKCFFHGLEPGSCVRCLKYGGFVGDEAVLTRVMKIILYDSSPFELIPMSVELRPALSLYLCWQTLSDIDIINYGSY